jgi:hypothetical protein
MARPRIGLPLVAFAVASLAACGAGDGDDSTLDHDVASADAGPWSDVSDSGRDSAEGSLGDADVAHGDVQSDAALDVDADVIGFPACIDTPCPEGYQCFSEGCLRVNAAGSECGPGSPGVQCETGTSCTTIDEALICTVDGSDGAFCRYGGGGECIFEETACDAGLGCDTSSWSRGVCRAALGPGELCGAPGDLCASDAACVPVAGTRRCVPRGQAGSMCVGASGASPLFGTCEADLICTQATSDCVRASDTCQREVEADGDCADRAARCPAPQVCAATPDGARCVAPDVEGAPCSTSDPLCGEGLACEWSATGGPTCVAVVAIGDACDAPRQARRCGEGASCTSDHASDPGVCAAPGTAAGADCRVEGAECAGDLVCSDFSRYRRTCRAAAGAGDSCDLGAIATTCGEGLRCAPTTALASGHLRSRCVPRAAESEPNERAVESVAVDTTVVIAGTLPLGDEDCVVVDLSGGDSLFVELFSESFGYTWPALVTLWRGDDELGRWSMFETGVHGPLTHVVRLEPRLIPLLANVDEGRYTLCVSRPGEALGGYELAVGVVQAP